METQPNDKFADTKVKSSIRLPLGSYSAAKIPVAVVLTSGSLCWLGCYYWPRDPRNDRLPLMGDFPRTILGAILYILFSLVWGPQFMENRKPIKPKKIMMAYNLVQVVLCSFIFIESGLSGWFFDYNWKCQPEDRSTTPKTLRMVFAVYLFYITKLMDYTDTVFLVLGKRWSGVSLLHVIHHSAMHLSSWVGIYYAPAGHLNFSVFVNSFIHILMYSYYLLAALGPSVQPYLWWKKYLTAIQMVQFLVIFTHNTQIFYRHCPDVSKHLAIQASLYTILYLYLFRDYYIHEYQNKKVAVKSS